MVIIIQRRMNPRIILRDKQKRTEEAIEPASEAVIVESSCGLIIKDDKKLTL